MHNIYSRAGGGLGSKQESHLAPRHAIERIGADVNIEAKHTGNFVNDTGARNWVEDEEGKGKETGNHKYVYRINKVGSYLGTVVAGDLAKALVAIDDREVDDLGVCQ